MTADSGERSGQPGAGGYGQAVNMDDEVKAGVKDDQKKHE